ncbi:MAG: DUF3800 domain-containing protein [Planctomycetota bacterium]|jgi:hypothetical protein
MAKTEGKIWHVYCDESRQVNEDYMVLGGVIVPGQQLTNLLDALQAWRQQHGMTAELKWTKVSKGKLEEYKAFVDAFFVHAEDDIIHFKSAVFACADIDYKSFHDGNVELGFYKLFYQFLVHRFGRYVPGSADRLVIHLDERSSPYNLSDLRDVLRTGIGRWYSTGRNCVASVEAMNSKTHEHATIMQIADVLIGAVGWHWNQLESAPGASIAKQALANHIADRAHLESLRVNTSRNARRFNIWRFQFKKRAPKEPRTSTDASSPVVQGHVH